ncbi:MAG TPA: amidohydrolase, partial [Gemmataceae bacterium]|nr:amidohydrolase [Gemmataceae bacterium]
MARRQLTTAAIALLLTSHLIARDDATPPDPKLAGRTTAIRAAIDAQFPSLDALYKDLHTHPELSLMEVRTSAHMADELRKAGYEVTTGVGGHGV